MNLDEEIVHEGLTNGAKEIEPLDKTELKEMSKYICKISGKRIGTGFFCKIKYENDLIPVLISNYHVIDDNYLKDKKVLKIYINNDSKFIDIKKDNPIYSSKIEDYDIIIIKLNEDDINDYLEIDENIFKINSENTYKDEQIYILHYPNSNKASISYGDGIEKISENNIKHLCNTQPGSSGGPILSRLTNKVIGIHKAYINKKNERYNIGTFLKFPLNDLNKKKNEIIIQIKIDKNDINKEIYFLDNTDFFDHNCIKVYHGFLKELNKYNTELYINDDKKEYKKYFIPEKEGIYTILLKLNISITDCSYMFYKCGNIINIDLSNFDTTNVTNMSNMFAFCYLLRTLSDISKWNTNNVTNMSHMFFECESLKSLPDISKWNTNNVTNMSFMFTDCISLESLPDISKWNTTNVTNMSCMFRDCESLKSLPDISKWNTTNVTDMSSMFSICHSLKSLPDISKWNTTNVIDMSYMFHHCCSLHTLPDISKWNTTNVIYMKAMFSECKSLKSITDISKWNTKNLIDMDSMFYNCSSLKSFPDISKWMNNNNINNKESQIENKIIIIYFKYKFNSE